MITEPVSIWLTDAARDTGSMRGKNLSFALEKPNTRIT